MSAELVLAIETSCDETAVAVADAQGRPLVSRIASQVKLHAPYGGVVPELASRNHSLDLRPLLDSALAEAGLTAREIGLVAATSGPGLASSLLVGDTLAKAVAVGLGCPFYSINHMEGHLLSP
jgi:N6-L-threonylcarbamoyladenine synthase